MVETTENKDIKEPCIYRNNKIECPLYDELIKKNNGFTNKHCLNKDDETCPSYEYKEFIEETSESKIKEAMVDSLEKFDKIEEIETPLELILDDDLNYCFETINLRKQANDGNKIQISSKLKKEGYSTECLAKAWNLYDEKKEVKKLTKELEKNDSDIPAEKKEKDNKIIVEFECNKCYEKIIGKGNSLEKAYTHEFEHGVCGGIFKFVREFNDIEITKEAINILRDKDPLEFILSTMNYFHKSDKSLMTIIHCSMVSSSIHGGNGIQPCLTGEKGEGKTDAADTAAHVNPRRVIKGSFSDKAIFYMIASRIQIISPIGMILYLDDNDLTPQLEGLMKRATSDFQKPTLHYSVGDKDIKIFELPPRTIWWLTSVNVTSSDQLADRFINLGVDDSDKTTQEVKARQFEIASKSKEKFEVTRNVLICRKMYDLITNQDHKIYLNPEDEKRITKDNSRRTNPMLFDIIKCITATYYMQRDGVASKEDWDKGLDILNKVSGTNKLKISPLEEQIYRLIPLKPEQIKYGDLFIKLLDEYKGKRPPTKGRFSQIMKGYKNSRTQLWELSIVDKLSYLEVNIDELKQIYYSKSKEEL